MTTHRINLLTSAAMVTGAIAALSNTVPNPEALHLSQQPSISMSAIENQAIIRDSFPDDHRLSLPISPFSGQFRAKEQVTPNSEIKAKVKEDLVTTVLASVVENIDDEENSIDVQPCRKYVWKQISDRWTIVNHSLNLNKNKKQTPA